jgi:hypothetical protein
MVQIGQLIKVHQLRFEVPYVIFAAERVTTRLGTTVALHLRDSTTTDQTYYLYLTKRYAKAFTTKDIQDINCDRCGGPSSTRVPTLSQTCTYSRCNKYTPWKAFLFSFFPDKHACCRSFLRRLRIHVGRLRASDTSCRQSLMVYGIPTYPI